MKSRDLVFDIMHSKNMAYHDFSGKDLDDAMHYGFAYVESEDNYVKYVAANSFYMKKILVEMPDAELSPDPVSIGSLWTSRLLVSNKIKNHVIVFSNEHHTCVLNVNVNKEHNRAQ
jgi:hypothetical protein